MELKEFFSYIRRNRSSLARDKVRFCESLATREPGLPAEIKEFLDEANTDDRNYAVSSAYALLMGDERRKKLSAYFTPPALARAAIDAAVPFLRTISEPTILDPACGGGSFLTPVARYLISRKCKRGVSTEEACMAALKNVRGIEIDSGLAALSQFLPLPTLHEAATARYSRNQHSQLPTFQTFPDAAATHLCHLEGVGRYC
jgi:adenine-specific DNA-methyltransferase